MPNDAYRAHGHCLSVTVKEQPSTPNEVEQRLREIEERLVGVSDGPWAISFPRRDYYLIESVADNRYPVSIAMVQRDPVVLDETWRTHKTNGRLMAHAREDIPFLLALLREREEENRRLREALDKAAAMVCAWPHVPQYRKRLMVGYVNAALRGESHD